MGVLRCPRRGLCLSRGGDQRPALLFRLQPSRCPLQVREWPSTGRSVASSWITRSTFPQLFPVRWETTGSFVVDPGSQTFEGCKIVDVDSQGSGVVVPWATGPLLMMCVQYDEHFVHFEHDESSKEHCRLLKWSDFSCAPDEVRPLNWSDPFVHPRRGVRDSVCKHRETTKNCPHPRGDQMLVLLDG